MACEHTPYPYPYPYPYPHPYPYPYLRDEVFGACAHATPRAAIVAAWL